jgi:hypothetical protein
MYNSHPLPFLFAGWKQKLKSSFFIVRTTTHNRAPVQLNDSYQNCFTYIIPQIFYITEIYLKL